MEKMYILGNRSGRRHPAATARKAAPEFAKDLINALHAFSSLPDQQDGAGLVDRFTVCIEWFKRRYKHLIRHPYPI